MTSNHIVRIPEKIKMPLLDLRGSLESKKRNSFQIEKFRSDVICVNSISRVGYFLPSNCKGE